MLPHMASRARRRWERINTVRPRSQKTIARLAVTEAVRIGVLSRPKTCSRCPNDRWQIQAHHDDYSKPLDVTWLCPDCHADEHPELPRSLFRKNPTIDTP